MWPACASASTTLMNPNEIPRVTAIPTALAVRVPLRPTRTTGGLGALSVEFTLPTTGSAPFRPAPARLPDRIAGGLMLHTNPYPNVRSGSLSPLPLYARSLAHLSLTVLEPIVARKGRNISRATRLAACGLRRHCKGRTQTPILYIRCAEPLTADTPLPLTLAYRKLHGPGVQGSPAMVVRARGSARRKPALLPGGIMNLH